MASGALLLSMGACSNKSANQETTEETPVDTLAMFNQLTPEPGVERTSQFHTTPTGIKYRIIKEGTGAMPKATDEVEVNYEGKLLTGQTFDSSYERGEPAKFPLDRVIPGWTEALQLMKEGGVYEFYIPWGMAYGPQGNQGIPPYSNLLFKVELIKVNPDSNENKAEAVKAEAENGAPKAEVNNDVAQEKTEKADAEKPETKEGK